MPSLSPIPEHTTAYETNLLYSKINFVTLKKKKRLTKCQNDKRREKWAHRGTSKTKQKNVSTYSNIHVYIDGIPRDWRA